MTQTGTDRLQLRWNKELKKLVGRAKVARQRFQTLINDRTWVDEARRYAERSRIEVQKLLEGDVSKVKSFLEKEKKELERFQKQIPVEVKKFKTLLADRRSELKRLVRGIQRGQFTRTVKAAKAKRGSSTSSTSSSRSTRSKKAEATSSSPSNS